MGGHVFAVRNWHKIKPGPIFVLKHKRYLQNEIINWLLSGNQSMEIKNCFHIPITF